MSSLPSSDKSQSWIRFLSRFAPLVSIDAALLIVIFLGAVGFDASDNALGPLYGELLGAARAPAAYQTAMFFDAFGWLTIGMSLVAFSRIVQGRSPIFATFILLAGVGHLLGFLGGILRMTAVHDLGVMYATANSATQDAIRTSFLPLYGVIGGLFTAGDVMAVIGWLCLGAAIWKTTVLPRWVAVWTLASGILVAIFTPLSLVQAEVAFPILLLYIVSGVIVFHLVFAVKFWRAPPPVT